MHKEEDLNTIKIIDNHLDRFFEEDEVTIFHDMDDEGNHIDVYWINPSNESTNYSILLTCGISRNGMKVPKELADKKYIELAMILPLSWNLHDYENRSAEEKWPVQHLKSIAKIPLENDTWLGFGHTISWSPNRDEKIPGTGFNSSIILEPLRLNDSFTEIIDGDKTIRILSVIPLYPEELTYKATNSSSELIDRFNEFKTEDILNLHRINTCKT